MRLFALLWRNPRKMQGGLVERGRIDGKRAGWKTDPMARARLKLLAPLGENRGKMGRWGCGGRELRPGRLPRLLMRGLLMTGLPHDARPVFRQNKCHPSIWG